jgi:hypothetical protein
MRIFTKLRVAQLLVVACSLGLALCIAAAETGLQANLFGQRGDQDASGRAYWIADGETGSGQFVVQVAKVNTSEMLMTFVDGRFVGSVEIDQAGLGSLLIGGAESETQPPRPGSIVELYGAEDGVLLLAGIFRRM